MRRISIILLLIICLCSATRAENTDNIYISVYQPERNEITDEASQHLVAKMKSLVLANGLSDENPNSRFVITAKILITQKDIVPSTPQRVSEKIDFTFMIGDVVENKVFESITVSSLGVDINETKTMIMAIKKVNFNNEKFKTFITNAKAKIVAYYSERCSEILTNAKQCAANHDFDNAIYQLMQIPPICDCANECQELELQIYQQRIDVNAEELYNKAKSLWASSPTEEGASQVSDIIKQIPAGSTSQDKVEALMTDIESKLKEDQRKAWNFKMQQYRDDIAREKREYAMAARQQIADNAYRAKQQTADNAYRAKQQASDNAYRSLQQYADNAARKQYIEAARQVGLAYATHQPTTVVYRKNVYCW